MAGVLGAAPVDVRELVESTRAAMKAGRSDAEVARGLAGVRLTEQLEIAVTEELQSEGAGAETVEALERLRELTREMPRAQGIVLFAAPEAPSGTERNAAIEKARAGAGLFGGFAGFHLHADGGAV